MTNHPNRNWRQRMQAAADQWLTTPAGRVLSEAPLTIEHEAARMIGLRNRLREAYLAGYADGRKREP